MGKESDRPKSKLFERFAKALLAVPAEELAAEKERYESGRDPNRRVTPSKIRGARPGPSGATPH